MQPIVPKGYDSNQFPPALDASQLAVREATATLAKAKESIESTKKLVNEQLNRYSNFFVPHFGLNPLKGIMEQFFPPGHSVKRGGEGRKLTRNCPRNNENLSEPLQQRTILN